ncbi:MAG: ParA family protein [Parvularculales bacterium]
MTDAPRKLVLANQKGGVGKTTVAINLGTALASIGKKVLLLDLDPQGNASTGLGVNPQQRRLSSYELLTEDIRLKEVILSTAVSGLDLIPASLDLLGVELELAEAPHRAHRLASALTENRAAVDFYDYIFMDCPPSLNLLTINAMTASDAILVPLQSEFFALEGLSQLLSTVEQVRSNLNERLTIQGIVLTMYDQRNNLCEQVATDVRQVLGDKVYDTIIPRNVRISEAPSHGMPVLVYDHQCAGSRSFMKLAAELMMREENAHHEKG